MSHWVLQQKFVPAHAIVNFNCFLSGEPHDELLFPSCWQAKLAPAARKEGRSLNNQLSTLRDCKAASHHRNHGQCCGVVGFGGSAPRVRALGSREGKPRGGSSASGPQSHGEMGECKNWLQHHYESSRMKSNVGVRRGDSQARCFDFFCIMVARRGSPRRRSFLSSQGKTG